MLETGAPPFYWLLVPHFSPQAKGVEMPEYLIVGVYADNGYQRFAEAVEAVNPEQAERVMRAAIRDREPSGDLVIAGVLQDGRVVA